MARARKNMLFFALLLAVVVPASSCAAATEELCFLQADINLDQEGGSHGKGHLVPEEDHAPEVVFHPHGGKKWDFAPRSASAQRPWTWEAIDPYQRQALLRESEEPDDAWANLFMQAPDHRSKKLITLLIVIVLACFTLYNAVLWRLHKAVNLEMAGRVSFGPSASEVTDSTFGKILESMCKLSPVWPAVILEALGLGIIGPSDQYLNLDYFSKKHGGPADGGFMCAAMPHMPACEKAVEENVHLTMILGAILPVVHVMFAPMLGALSDSLGRRPVICAVQALLFVTPLFRCLYVFWGVNLEVSFWLTPLADIPIAGVLAAYFSDMVEDTRILAALFGLLGAIGGVGALVGLFIGKSVSIKTAFIIYIIIKALQVLYVFLFLPESLPRERKASFSWRYLIPGVSLDVLIKTPIRRTLTVIVLAATFIDSGWGRIVPSYHLKYFNWTKDANYTFGITSLVSNIVWQGLLLPHITNLVGETNVISLARWAGEFAGVGLILSTLNWHVFTYVGLFMGPLCMAFPVLQALQSRSMSAQEQGRALSALNTIKMIAEAIGPPIFGAIFDANRDKPQLQMAWRMCLTGTGVNIICLAAVFLLPKQIKELTSEERAARRKAKAEKTPMAEEDGWLQHNTKDILQKRITWANNGTAEKEAEQ